MQKNIRLYYFLVSVVGGVFATAMPIYYQSLNFSSYQIGILISLPSVAMMFQPVWGMIVDRFQIAKQIGMFGIICSSLILALLLFVNSFWGVFFIVGVYAFIKSPVWSSIDNIIITYCMNNNIGYGPLRVFASIAWGSSLLIFLPFILIFGFKSYFLINIVVCICAAYIIFKLPHTTALTDNKTNLADDASFSEGLKYLATNKQFYFLIAFTFFFSSMFVTNLNYQALYFEQLGQSSLFISTAMFLSILPEFIILPFVERLSGRTNPLLLLLFVTICYIVKFTGFALVSDVHMLLALTLLHGIGISFYIPIFVKLLKSSVPNNVSTTALTINGFMAAVSGTITSLLAGYIHGSIGIRGVFLLNAGFMVIAFLLIAIYMMFTSKSENSNI